MVKKICILLLLIFTSVVVLPTSDGYALTKSQKQSKCEVLKKNSKATQQNISYKGSVIPVSLLKNFSNTVHNISDNLVSIQVLGDSLMCHAVYGAPWKAVVMKVQLFDWANIPIWLCGAIIYCFGFMLVLSVTFYIVDVSFKLGFSIIVLPIAIALWPFAWTKDKLMVCISVFLKSAGILVFLALTTAYALNILVEAIGGLPPIMEALTENKTREVAETFSLTSGQFLLIVVVLIYGMKMIGATIPDYVDKFFPDEAFGKGKQASPMHTLATQGVDFVKQKAVAPAAKFTHDVLRTQGGRLVSFGGRVMQGQYHNQIKRAIHNPKETLQKIDNKFSSGAASVEKYFRHKYNNVKFGAKSALGSVMLSGQGKEAFQAHVAQQRNTANQKVDQWAQNVKDKYKADNASLNAQIQQKEDERNANPSALRKFESQISGLSQKASDWHQANQNEAQRKLDNLSNRLKDRLLKKGKENETNQWLDQKAEALKTKINETKTVTWLRRRADKLDRKIEGRKKNISDWANNKINNIENGKLAEKAEDGWVNWAQKRIRRGVSKTLVNMASTTATTASTAFLRIRKNAVQIARIPVKIATGSINSINKGLQKAVDGVSSVRNGWRRTKFLISKDDSPKFVFSLDNMRKYASAYTQKYGDRALQKVESLKNIWKVPGKILEGTGDAMQHNKPRDYTYDDAKNESRRLKEEEEREKRENS